MLSPEEFARLLEAVDQLEAKGELAGDLARMVVVAAWTGCRSGEVRALRWNDIAGNELRIERSVWRRHEGATKTDDPRRVAIVGPVADALEAQRRWLIATQHESGGLRQPPSFPSSRLRGNTSRIHPSPRKKKAPKALLLTGRTNNVF